MRQNIRFGYTPDPDDAYHYYALESGHLSLGDEYQLSFIHEHIQKLNEKALSGALDVTAISSIFYPRIENEYVILASGTSVGRTYGPVLGAKIGSGIHNLKGKRVAVPGLLTTGNFLVNYFYDGFEVIPMAFDEVVGAIQRGDVDAGVFIHEELINYQYCGIEKICCLGNRWHEATKLPLPVGLTVAKRELGQVLIGQISEVLSQSMRHAMQYPEDAIQFAKKFSREVREGIVEDFVNEFSNTDTLSMPEDVRAGLKEVYYRAWKTGFIDHEPRIEII